MTSINTVLLLGGVLLALSVLASALSARIGLPLLLMFLGIGMLAGEEGPGGIRFDDYQTAFFVGNLALAVILLDGGLRTRLETFRVALWPAATLATIGVAATSGLLGLFAAWLLDVNWRYGLLLGAIVGSTDAAAVFSLLRHSGVRLNERVRATLEIESGANDPMAIFLVLLFIGVLQAPDDVSAGGLGLSLVTQFGLGVLLGLAGGRVLSSLIRRLRLLSEGLYALLIVSGGLVIFALTNLAGGSGFLAIYLAGLVIGNRRSRATEHVLQVMDGLAWLAQAGMFLVLGMLVTPSALLDNAWAALLIALFLMLVARPLAVLVSLAPFRFPPREIGYIGWVGLRGAVPIVLAVFPMMAGLPGADLLFDVAFVVVLVSLLVQGASVPWVARRLKVVVPHRAEPIDELELWINRDQSLNIVAYRVEPDAPIAGTRPGPAGELEEILGARALLRVQNGERRPEADRTPFEAGELVWLLTEHGKEAALSRLFSGEEQERALVALNFFGEFVLDGSSRAADLEAAYWISLEAEERELNVAALLQKRLGRPPVEGDHVMLGSLRLTVREMEHGQVRRVGLKLRATP